MEPHIIVGTKVNTQGRCVYCRLVVRAVEKENVGDGEQRVPAWEGVAALKSMVREGSLRG